MADKECERFCIWFYNWKTIKNKDIEISVLNNFDPSPVANIYSEGYRILQQTVNGVFPKAVVAPCLMVAGTDARIYAPITDNIFRFIPFQSMYEDQNRVHASGERMHIESLKQGVAFYYNLIRNCGL